jgi:hypothetical protein
MGSMHYIGGGKFGEDTGQKQLNYSHLSFNEYQDILKQSQNLSYNEHLSLLAQIRENKQKTDDMKYKIFNVKDLLAEIQYEGVRKGTKTEAYLEDVIASINRSGKYRWVQFFQLVDVFYVVVSLSEGSKTKTATEEIRDHYSNVEPSQTNQTANQTTNIKVEEKAIKSAPVSLKTSMPWKK